MKVQLENDGPVTIIIDSRRSEYTGEILGEDAKKAEMAKKREAAREEKK